MPAARLLPLFLLFLPACAASMVAPPSPPASAPFDRSTAEKQVAAVLDDLHDAAAHADEARYFGHFAPHGVFVGTDATERWDLPAFRAYAHPHFVSGKGWTYRPVRRAVTFDASGRVAWFDEDLQGERVGATRGSGVLVREGPAAPWQLEQYVLSFTVPNERFAALRAALDAPAAADPKVTRDAAYHAATEAAAAGDLGRAEALLAALVPDAKTRPADDAEFWLHNELTWLKWAAGDLAGARAEVEQARATLDHALLPAEASGTLRLHERWDRAYLALDAGLKTPPAERARAIADADRARADYESIARPAGDHDGLAVLAAYFAARRGDGKRAVAEAAKVDPDKDTDLQDLYVLSLAFDAGAEPARATAMRARVCSGHVYLMKPLLARALAASGHPCDRP